MSAVVGNIFEKWLLTFEFQDHRTIYDERTIILAEDTEYGRGQAFAHAHLYPPPPPPCMPRIRGGCMVTD